MMTSHAPSVPVTLRIAGLLHFIWAGLFGLVVALQAVLVLTGRMSIGPAVWNLLVVAIYVRIGVGCWQLKPWAYDWGVGTNTLNLLMGMGNIASGVGPLAILLPIELAALLLLLKNKELLKPEAVMVDPEAGGGRAASFAVTLVGMCVVAYTLVP